MRSRTKKIIVPAGFWRNMEPIVSYELVKTNFSENLSKQAISYKRGFLEVPIWALPKSFRGKIPLFCSQCNKGPKYKVLVSLRRGTCSSCSRKLVGISRKQLAIKGDEVKYHIKIKGTPGVKQRSDIRKKCGCVVFQSRDTIHNTGLKACKCDQFYWQLLQEKVCNFLKVPPPIRTIKFRGKRLSPDGVNDRLVIEIKAVSSALQKRAGSNRDPMEVIKNYSDWAKNTGKKFFVLVAEPDRAVKAWLRKNFGNAPEYFLGLDQWYKVGLTSNQLQKIQELRADHAEGRIRNNSDRKKIFNRFKRISLKKGYWLTSGEIKNYFKLSKARVHLIIGGKSHLSRGELNSVFQVHLPSGKVARSSQGISDIQLERFVFEFVKKTKTLPRDIKTNFGVGTWRFKRVFAGNANASWKDVVLAIEKIVGFELPKGQALRRRNLLIQAEESIMIEALYYYLRSLEENALLSRESIERELKNVSSVKNPFGKIKTLVVGNSRASIQDLESIFGIPSQGKGHGKTTAFFFLNGKKYSTRELAELLGVSKFYINTKLSRSGGRSFVLPKAAKSQNGSLNKINPLYWGAKVIKLV